jgi:5-methylcytosine-specific restriction endonuclease McrA
MITAYCPHYKKRKKIKNTCYHQSTEYKKKILERDNYTCQLCGSPGYYVDHIKPWAISHDSSPSNLRAICLPCNLALRRKRFDAALDIKEWEQWLLSELQLAD